MQPLPFCYPSPGPRAGARHSRSRQAMTDRARSFVRSWVLPFVDPRHLASITLLPRFLLEWRNYRKRSPGERVRLWDAHPCLADRLPHTPFDPHYFYQAAWLARRVAQLRPGRHVDVGSSVDLIGVLSSIVPVVFADYRPLRARLPNLCALAATATRLPFGDCSLESVSSLHVLEHIGLGRYGDPIDPEGSRLAARELVRVLRPGGRLYLSVPVGRERVCFNAHRVFAAATVVSMLQGARLTAFDVVDDAGCLTLGAALSAADRLEYGCGMYELVKDA